MSFYTASTRSGHRSLLREASQPAGNKRAPPLILPASSPPHGEAGRIIRKLVMNKFMILLVIAAGMCGSAGAATTPPAMSNAAAASCATGATNNVPCQVEQLQAEIQALQGQVHALQSGSPTQSDDVRGRTRHHWCRRLNFSPGRKRRSRLRPKFRPLQNCHAEPRITSRRGGLVGINSRSAK